MYRLIFTLSPFCILDFWRLLSWTECSVTKLYLSHATGHIKKALLFSFWNNWIKCHPVQNFLSYWRNFIRSFWQRNHDKLQVNDLILHLNRIVYERNHNVRTDEKKSLMEALLELINNHIDQNLSLEYLASQLYVSKLLYCTYFQRSAWDFHSSIYHPSAFNNLQRCSSLRYACCQIKWNLWFQRLTPVFTGHLKKEYGISPQDYKKEHLKFLWNNFYNFIISVFTSESELLLLSFRTDFHFVCPGWKFQYIKHWKVNLN